MSVGCPVQVNEPASAMIREILELRPTLLLNRVDEAFREALPFPSSPTFPVKTVRPSSHVLDNAFARDEDIDDVLRRASF